MAEKQSPPTKQPLQRSLKAQQRAEARAAERAQKALLAQAQTKAQEQAAQLAQIVNLHIAGYSLAQIGASIGATADEVDRLLTTETARYVRSQPALRTYVRNWASEKYTQLLDAVWAEATDRNHPEKLENQDRAVKIIDRMVKLHGAEAPVQSEIKVEAAPEAVEKLVSALAAGQGLDYDLSVFDGDVVDAEVISDAVDEAHQALEAAGIAADQPQEGESDDGF